MGERENALVAAIIEWQSGKTKVSSGELDWKAIVKILSNKFPDLATGSKKAEKGGSTTEWRELWTTISTSYTEMESESNENGEKGGQSSSSSSSSASPSAVPPIKGSNKRKFNDDIESAETLNSVNVLPCKVYNDLSKGLHLEGNDTTISNMVSACEVRKKIKDGYQEGRPVMHNYEPSVNVLFYPTVMSYVQDDQQSFVRSSKTGLSGRVAALNPLSNRVISFKGNL